MNTRFFKQAGGSFTIVVPFINNLFISSEINIFFFNSSVLFTSEDGSFLPVSFFKIWLHLSVLFQSFLSICFFLHSYHVLLEKKKKLLSNIYIWYIFSEEDYQKRKGQH